MDQSSSLKPWPMQPLKEAPNQTVNETEPSKTTAFSNKANRMQEQENLDVSDGIEIAPHLPKAAPKESCSLVPLLLIRPAAQVHYHVTTRVERQQNTKAFPLSLCRRSAASP